MRTSPTTWVMTFPAIAVLVTISTALAAEADNKAANSFEDERHGFVRLLCRGSYAGKKISRGQFTVVLRKHEAWLNNFDTIEKQESDTARNDPRRADLCGVDMRQAVWGGVNLSGANLDGTNLSGGYLQMANLSGANLVSANLSRTDLSAANLSGANLDGTNLNGARLAAANLSGASLGNANLGGTVLPGANLSEASLGNANLGGAQLQWANLNGALLTDANLSGASLYGASLNSVRFEPKELPLIDGIAAAKNLELMYRSQRPEALVRLRKAFEDGGYREQARKITYAIKRSEYRANPAAFPTESVLATIKMELGWNTVRVKSEPSEPRTITEQTTDSSTTWKKEPATESIETKIDLEIWKLIEDTFRYVFFDLPTQWGMEPGRAIRVLIVLLGVFSFPYIIALRYPGRGRIYRRWGADRPTAATASKHDRKRATSSPHPDIEPLQYAWPKAISRGLQFSLVSAFHIGFREFNVGNWISRLQPRDYTLYATGWVRSVAGTQALISVYLLAMWALTYFGRPFE